MSLSKTREDVEEEEERRSGPIGQDQRAPGYLNTITVLNNNISKGPLD